MKQFSLKIKLLLICFCLSSISLVVGFIAYKTIRGVDEDYKAVVSKTLPKSELVIKMQLRYARARLGLRILTSPQLSEEGRLYAQKLLSDAFTQYEEIKQNYLSLKQSDKEKEVFKDLENSWTSFKSNSEKIIDLSKHNTLDSQKEIVRLFSEETILANAYIKAVKEFENSIKNDVDFKLNFVSENSSKALYIMGMLVFAGFIFGLSAGYIFSLKIIRTLNHVSEELTNGAQSILDVSTQINQESQSLAVGTSQQAVALQETSSAIEETKSMVEMNALNSKKSSEVSSSSQESAEKGKEAIDEMLGAISQISNSNGEIFQQVEDSNQQISEIVKVISEIGAKTKVINDIVFQTKLLSFNASVEAARAGEHGKGFAVVAEEVGNLAQMSGNSAKEIADMLDSGIHKVEEIVRESKTKIEKLMLQGKEKIDLGTQTAEKCKVILDEIVQNVKQVNIMVNDISVASEEQSRGITEINKAVAELDQVANQTNKTSKSSANSSVMLKDEAENLKSIVSELKNVISGQKAA